MKWCFEVQFHAFNLLRHLNCWLRTPSLRFLFLLFTANYITNHDKGSDLWTWDIIYIWLWHCQELNSHLFRPMQVRADSTRPQWRCVYDHVRRSCSSFLMLRISCYIVLHVKWSCFHRFWCHIIFQLERLCDRRSYKQQTTSHCTKNAQINYLRPCSLCNVMLSIV